MAFSEGRWFRATSLPFRTGEPAAVAVGSGAGRNGLGPSLRLTLHSTIGTVLSGHRDQVFMKKSGPGELANLCPSRSAAARNQGG